MALVYVVFFGLVLPGGALRFLWSCCRDWISFALVATAAATLFSGIVLTINVAMVLAAGPPWQPSLVATSLPLWICIGCLAAWAWRNRPAPAVEI
jgi:hypothetical protein